MTALLRRIWAELRRRRCWICRVRKPGDQIIPDRQYNGMIKNICRQCARREMETGAAIPWNF